MAPTAVRLGLAMLGLQLAIGTVNDVVDAPLDARGQPWKAIPSGVVTPRAALAIAGLAAALGLGLAAASGWPTLLLGIAGLSLGLAYDLWLKPTRLAWFAYAIGLPLVPAFAWFGAVGTAPPRFEVIAPLAALAGAALAIGNAAADVEADRRAQRPTAAAALGPRAGGLAVLGLTVIVYALAVLTFGRGGLPPLLSAAVVSSAIGLLAAAAPGARLKRLGWGLQALGFGLLATAWLAGQAIS